MWYQMHSNALHLQLDPKFATLIVLVITRTGAIYENQGGSE